MDGEIGKGRPRKYFHVYQSSGGSWRLAEMKTLTVHKKLLTRLVQQSLVLRVREDETKINKHDDNLTLVYFKCSHLFF